MFGALRETAAVSSERQWKIAVAEIGSLHPTHSQEAANEWGTRRVTDSRKVWGQPRFVWGGALAALLVAIVLPVAVHHPAVPATPVAETPAPAAVTVEVSDDALLNSIQNDLSSSVPASLEPLAGTTSATKSNQ
jgi:hypothetical protein